MALPFEGANPGCDLGGGGGASAVVDCGFDLYLD